ncbi:MAG: restriction endonuclease subunit S [Clostridium perfringens]|nr:restriction endonuclease subunit S [Clostridium perfringens]
MKKEVREGYKITELGEIPNEWDIIALGEIGEFKNGINKSKEDFGFGCKFVNIQDAYSGNIVKNDLLERINVNDKEKEIYKLENDDIILVRSSVKPEGVGYPILFKKENEDIVYCGFMIRYRYNKRKINPMFLLYQLRSENIRKRVLDLSTVSANTNINQDSYKQIKISIPSVKEQEKIAEILSTVDEQIENIEKLIQKNQELKRGLMQQLLTKGIGHTEFKKTELGIIPKKWRLKKIDEIGKVITGNTPKTTEKDNYGDEFLWVSPFDMGNSKYIKNTNKMLSKKGFDKARKLPSGAVLVTCIGSTIGKIGIATNELSTNQQINSIICNEDVDSEFIYYAIDYNFSKYSNYISNQAVPIINKSTFGEFLIQIPELKEQNKVAKILSKVDDNIEKQLNKKKKLEILRNGLMQQLLTGNIRVI